MRRYLILLLLLLNLIGLSGCMWLIGEPPWASLGIFKRTEDVEVI